MTDIANIPNLAVAADTVTNVELIQVVADNATIGTSFETIGNTNADAVLPVIAGADIDVVSADNSSDIAAGTGARTIKITYLDDSFNQASEEITLTGTTPVELTEQNITFIQDAELLTTGTDLIAAGAITIADVTGGGVHGLIDVGSRNMATCQWMVPAGHSGYVHGFWADVDAVAAGQGTAEVALQISHAGFTGVANSEVWKTIAKISIVENDSDVVAATGGNQNSMTSFSFPGNQPYVVPAKTMVRLAGKAFSTAVACTAGFSMSVQGSGSGTSVVNS